MEKDLSVQLQNKKEQLNISADAMGKLLNLNKESIPKWLKGTKPTDLNILLRLKSFIKGDFDQFIINGRLPKNYDFEEAIEKLYPRNPTNDFMGNMDIYNQTLADIEQIPILPKYWLKELEAYEKANDILTKDKHFLQVNVETLKLLNKKLTEELEEYKTKYKNQNKKAS